MSASNKAQAEAVAIVRAALSEHGYTDHANGNGTTVAYVRMSEDLKRDAKGVSRDAVAIVRYAIDHKIALTPDPMTGLPVFVDNSISASKFSRTGKLKDDNQRKRPAYARILAELRTGQRQGLLTPHLDRLYRRNRELDDLVDLVEDVDDRGTRVVITTLKGGNYDLTDANDVARAHVETSFAAQQSARTHERVLNDNEEVRQRGWWVGSRAPMGYVRTKEPPFLAIDPDVAAIVRKAIVDIVAGVTIADVARRWNAMGFGRARSGRPWTTMLVRQALDRPALAGIVTHKPLPARDGTEKPVRVLDEITAGWEPIVDRPTWDAFQGRLSLNRNRYTSVPRRRGAFTGVFFCSVCHHALYRQKHNDSWSWTCLRREHGELEPPGCGGVSVMGPQAEAEIRARVERALADGKAVDHALNLDDGSAVADAQAEVARIDGILMDYQAGMAEDPPRFKLPEYYSLRDPWLKRRERAEKALVDAQAAALRFATSEINAEGLLSFAWDRESDDQRRRVIGYVFPFGVEVRAGYGRKELAARLVALEVPAASLRRRPS